jgi:hypothetical protein
MIRDPNTFVAKCNRISQQVFCPRNCASNILGGSQKRNPHDTESDLAPRGQVIAVTSCTPQIVVV